MKYIIRRRQVKLALPVLAAMLCTVVLGAQILAERTIPVPRDPIPVPHGLRWTTSVAEENDIVWIVDSATNRIGRLAPDGALESRTVGGLVGPDSGQEPALRQIRKDDEGYLLLVLDEGRHRLYQTKATLEEVSGKSDRLGEPLVLSDGLDDAYQIFDYAPIRGSGRLSGHTIALIDLNVQDVGALTKFGGAPGWRMALVLIDAEGLVTPLVKDFESLLASAGTPVGTDPLATRRDYSLDDSMRYLAVATDGEKAYVLLLRSPARLIEVDLQQQTWDVLQSFPEGFSEFVSFSSMPNYQDFESGAARLMGWLSLKEEMRLPIGVYTDSQGRLFVLGKTERAPKGIEFDLVEVSTKTGAELGSYRLPLPRQAAHLLVASPKAHDESWGLLIKAPLREFGGRYSLRSFEYRNVSQDTLLR